ncbi:MAG TPA: alpha/beta hydrolase [Xanthomonadales bacterium]|nr:alpha/beta hydrolase [Xanthomonadales bacterium]
MQHCHALKKCFVVIVIILSGQSALADAAELMDASSLAFFPNPPADHVIFYGQDKLQFGELRLAAGQGPHPVMVLIHGGCWRSQYDIAHIRKLAAAFTATGITTWTIEYRRVGDPGGGWPGTFDDIANGADHLVALAGQYDLDLNRLIVAGHSAGGHLAIWLAHRPAEWPPKLQPRAVLALAPAADLAYLEQQGVCGDVVEKLVGGSPEQYPQRYQLVSGTSRLPLPIPQYIVIGELDANWAPVGRRYIDSARRQGNDPHVINANESGHLEMIDPDSATWPLVLHAARSALGLDEDVSSKIPTSN